MNRLFLVLFLFSWVLVSCQKQEHELSNYKLFVTLENAPFDSLYLFDYTNRRDIFIAGEKIHRFTWKFAIPDSIVWNSENMNLIVAKYDFISNSLKEVRFITEREGKKIIVGNVGVEDRENYIHATYMERTVFPDEYMMVKIENIDSVVFGDIICEDFKLILQDDSSNITIRAQDPFFSWFINLNNEELSYDEYLMRYLELSKKYPDSKFLMCYLSLMLNRYQSKKDVQSIYDNLSGKHKNTHWAKEIERFLSTGFENTSLPTIDLSSREDIVQDYSKYNLIVFTASWCKPCLEEIPLLKKIYLDLQTNLI
jgi:hypothetical protein